MIGALDMNHESSSALSNEVIALRAQVSRLRLLEDRSRVHPSACLLVAHTRAI